MSDSFIFKQDWFRDCLFVAKNFNPQKQRYVYLFIGPKSEDVPNSVYSQITVLGRNDGSNEFALESKLAEIRFAVKTNDGCEFTEKHRLILTTGELNLLWHQVYIRSSSEKFDFSPELVGAKKMQDVQSSNPDEAEDKEEEEVRKYVLFVHVGEAKIALIAKDTREECERWVEENRSKCVDEAKFVIKNCAMEKV